MFFPMDGRFSRKHVREPAAILAAGTLFVIILAAPAKGGNTIICKLSSGGIKNPTAGQRSQCCAMAMVAGSTFTPGPMVEESAIRCK